MSDTKATIAGLVAVALPLWVRAQDDNDRELRNNRLDLRDLEDKLRACCNHGSMIRNRLPINQDIGVGLALGNPKPVIAEILPTTTTISRPAIGDDAMGDYKWPPRTGTYNNNGAVSEIGEMTRTALAWTFQETRAWVDGFTLPNSPSQTATTQVFYAARALSTVLASLSLSRADYTAAWSKLFGTTAPSVGAPTIINVQATNNIQSVLPVPGSAFSNRAMRLRITAGPGNYAANTDVATIAFSQQFPVIPAIVGTNVRVSAVTTNGFTFQLSNGINAGNFEDVDILIGV